MAEHLMKFARCFKKMRGVRRLKQGICLFLVSKQGCRLNLRGNFASDFMYATQRDA